jgi:adenosylcobinamide-GDP ribazoletransferase
MLSGLAGAAQFLTRIPVRTAHPPDLARSVPWFPVVGALIGAAVGALAAGLFELVPAAVAASVAVLCGVALTGAFHEDGLADTADALGGWTPEQRRQILQDSRHGTYGVAALTGSILVRAVAVASLGPAAACAALVAAHTMGRGTAVVVMGSAPPAPTEGLGADYTRAVTVRRASAGGVVAVTITALATGWWVLPVTGASALAAVAVTWLAIRAFEGVSGDILGAIEQVTECTVLVVVSGLAMRHPVWWA